MNIPIAQPLIGPEETSAVLDVLSSGHLVQGQQVAAFEQAFAALHQARHAVATSSGTTALMAALMAHGIQPGDEVIVPSFSFFATASCVLSVGACPVFADIDPDTFCLSPPAAEAAITPRTAAIMPVHLFGLPADMDQFAAICQRHGLLLLEDAAQAHGAAIDGRPVGHWGTASFSFYPSKNMTTGEGGMVLTNDEALAARLRMIRNQGMSQQYRHEVLGYNFRMTDLAAALGLAQLRRLPEWNAQRRANAACYDDAITSLQTPGVPPGYTHVYHQYTVRVPVGLDRDATVAALNERGIGARVYYPTAIHCQPVLQADAAYRNVDLPATMDATRRVISLPVHPAITAGERDFIVESVNALC